MGFFTKIKLPQDIKRIQRLADTDRPEGKNFTHISATLLYTLIMKSFELEVLKKMIKKGQADATKKGKK